MFFFFLGWPRRRLGFGMLQSQASTSQQQSSFQLEQITRLFETTPDWLRTAIHLPPIVSPARGRDADDDSPATLETASAESSSGMLPSPSSAPPPREGQNPGKMRSQFGGLAAALIARIDDHGPSRHPLSRAACVVDVCYATDGVARRC